MTTIIKKITIAFLALLVIVGVVAPFANVFAATFNNDSRDYATLQVSNYTRNPGSSANWSNSVSANEGEVVSFLVYYHNTASDTANNTRIRVKLPSGMFTNSSIQGDVWANNESAVAGTASVSLSSNQTLTFIPGSVVWYPNQSTVSQTLPNGQNGSEIVSSNGLIIGDIASGWDAQGYIVFRAQVSSTPTGSLATVTTQSASSLAQRSATISALIDANGANTSTWFEYGTAPSFGSITAEQTIGSSASGSNITAYLTNLSPNTTYHYRAVARNAHGIAHGVTLQFSTLVAGAQATAVTNGTNDITGSSATITGAVNPNNANTAVWFEYGTSALFGRVDGSRSIGSGSASVELTFLLTGLTPRTLYYYRVVAQNSYGTTYGSTIYFTTKADGPVPPVVNGPSIMPSSY